MRAYLFNSDTDMALAQDRASYTAPRNIQGLMRDLALLPALLMEEGERGCVLVHDASIYKENQERLIRYLRDDFRLIGPGSTGISLVTDMRPWGWNRSLRNHLLGLGIRRDVLPGEDQIASWRALSSRGILEPVSERFRNQPGMRVSSRNLHSQEEVAKLLEESQAYVLKEPYSSSGKGLLWMGSYDREKLMGRIRKVIREQGLITAMPVYDRVQDFAMEFMVDGSGARFLGYSLFMTSQRGAYEGNLCLCREQSERILSRWLPLELLERARNILLDLLPDLGYQGPMGVDMMVARDPSGGCFLVPLIEMNLRLNMGILSLRIKERMIAPGCYGVLRIQHFASPEELGRYVREVCQDLPQMEDGGRILSGVLPLSLVDDLSQNLALLEVFPDTDL